MTGLTCDIVTDQGLLIQLADQSLGAVETSEVLGHLQHCSACLKDFATIMEMHGQVVIGRYWDQILALDPASPAV
ncbi:MAG: hypothetical protein ABI743_03140 [bacterium]